MCKGHPGVNNTFMVATGHSTAVLYNDVSVLENFHANKACTLLQQEKLNVLAQMEPADAKQVRKLMIGMILGTDMVKHLEHLNSFQACTCARVEAYEATASPADKVSNMTDEHRTIVLNAVVHLADLSGPTKPWAISKTWTARVLKEFYDQGKEEKRLGIPIEPLNDGTKANVGVGQKGFIQYVVAPLWAIWEELTQAGANRTQELAAGACEPISIMGANLQEWTKLVEAGDKEGNAFVAEMMAGDVEI
jgi:hypothetical protein